MAESIESAHDQGHIVRRPHVGRNGLFGHGLFIELDQLALAVSPVDDCNGSGRVQQVVGEHGRQFGAVGHRIEDARCDDPDAQPVIQPSLTEVAGRGQIDQNFNRKDHQSDRGDEFD